MMIEQSKANIGSETIKFNVRLIYIERACVVCIQFISLFSRCTALARKKMTNNN